MEVTDLILKLYYFEENISIIFQINSIKIIYLHIVSFLSFQFKTLLLLLYLLMKLNNDKNEK